MNDISPDDVPGTELGRTELGRTELGGTEFGRTALLVVDVQNDFCEGGSLAVVGGTQVAADISGYLRTHRDRYAIVVGSVDDHEAGTSNEGHIAIAPDEPDFVDQWPAHCIRHSPGAQSPESLDVSLVEQFVRKGHGRPAYSAFDGHTEDGQSLTQLLHGRGVRSVHIAGLATDYCVRATALDARRERFETTVLLDLTAAVSPGSIRRVLDELSAAGCLLRGGPGRDDVRR